MDQKYKNKKIYDSLHGYIYISPLVQQIIDNNIFQRLRSIKQLGTSNFIFSGGTHTRMQHSLGVFHLAHTLLQNLKKKHPRKITNKHIELISIAALIHDLGHSAFSHVFDLLLKHIDAPEQLKQHEYRSICLFKIIVEKFQINISQEEISFIQSCIVPTEENKKLWMFQIVSNIVDVDRMDYMLRDSQNIGLDIPFTKNNLENILQNMFIKNNQIYFENSVEYDIYNLLLSRKFLHTHVYQHKVNIAIEFMIQDILQLVEFKFDIKRSVLDIENRFCQINDSFLEKIYYETQNVQAKNLIERIFTRNFYGVVKVWGKHIEKDMVIKQTSFSEKHFYILNTHVSMDNTPKHPMLLLKFRNKIQKEKYLHENFKEKVSFVIFKNKIDSLRFDMEVE